VDRAIGHSTIAGLGLVVAGWAVVCALGLAATVRLVARDRGWYAFAIDAYTFWLYLPAYVVGIGAWLAGLGALAIAALLLVVCHVVWIAPSLGRGAPRAPEARAAPRFVLASSNLRHNNLTPDALVRELRSFDADVVSLQEVTPAWVERFRAHGLFDRFPYRVLAPVDGLGGTGILSRFPIESSEIVEVRGSRFATATIAIAGQSVQLVSVHPLAPVTFELWDAQRREITAFAQRASRPLVLAGDFNATAYNRWLGELKDLDLASAHALLGRGLATTWPNGVRRLPPIRLDHVFVSPTVVPLAIAHGRGPGSDHRPVVVTLALREA
jgi:endonuclease/exonuclease/phosphatase (EEP) superfamily protein YafD